MQKQHLFLLITSLTSIILGTNYYYNTPLTETKIPNRPFLDTNDFYQCHDSSTPCLQYEFSLINYTWQNPEDYEQYMQDEIYTQTVISGIKVSKTGRMFISLPRWVVNENGQSNPATLVEIEQGQPKRNPLLTPYPSWELNQVLKEGENGFNSENLQSVLCFEIVENIMWVVDQAIIGGNYVEGTIKLLKINLDTNQIEYVYRFPEKIVHRDSFLNDIVVDPRNNFIYITDSNNWSPAKRLVGAIITVDFSQTPFRVQRQMSGSYYTRNQEDFWLQINGERALRGEPQRVAIDGIALSPDYEHLTFCPLQGMSIFTIPTKYLRDFDYSDFERGSYTKSLFRRHFSSDGLAYGSNGDLFMGNLQSNGVFRYRSTKDQILLNSDEENQVWPDTFAFNHKGSLIYSISQLIKFNNGDIDFHNFDKPYYRIYSIYVGTNSYLDAGK